ncbi:MAG: cysteine--tRNA ligase [Chloroflexi bacterium]|jgi:cysteinyl-tRNA synthetase|uniref:Cysteine--tRNA ligase n=1 Tax=Candidatus Thermofonsia Clade 3 bacterium TaxID=2364212 RepID=A0A2M8QDA6_9CHLR|nr:cysteine--tRNA ligase [Candidatus Roseilinea sp. NK_OTU-006]PJF47793.1 MAG: cysteine--tRNA ligase [Candidatus Thermofonsia Clade 3 bacterium]RMG64607.1 MAG: cysteine--tRNA ligase [Chloroflexota bacterium]
MSLIIYNVLKREKEPFRPIVEGRVFMYVCGPTVYDHAHLGHAKTYVSFDAIVRWLRYSGYKVRYVQNITDVGHMLDDGEDRILKGARRERVEPMELVERYMRSYFEDMDALGVVRPDISPRASAHIPEQIEMIQTLIEKGHAYVVNGSVYFSVESDPDYGKLSGRRLEEMEAGKRIAVRDEKRHPMDFALWVKAPENHILQWPSPWGRGYPGWHIECSAMSTKYLGANFDIHGGGIDNIFPHNEAEIAQSECAHGVPFANYWVLTGSLLVNGVKMSKSLGNFVTIKDALKSHRPEALRYFILSGKYSNPADYSAEALDAASKGVERIDAAVRRVRDALKHAPESGDEGTRGQLMNLLDQTRMLFASAMNDDFNTPLALAALFDMSKEINHAISSGIATRQVLEQALAIYTELGGDVLGVVRSRAAPSTTADSEREVALIEILIEMRNEARKARDYARADAIRDRLAKLGIVLEDGPKGTSWRIAS